MTTMSTQIEIDIVALAESVATDLLRAEGSVNGAVRTLEPAQFIEFCNLTHAAIGRLGQSKALINAAQSRLYGAVRTAQSRAKKLKNHWLSEWRVSRVKGAYILTPREGEGEGNAEGDAATSAPSAGAQAAAAAAPELLARLNDLQAERDALRAEGVALRAALEKIKDAASLSRARAMASRALALASLTDAAA
jgi:hypothetical protein